MNIGDAVKALKDGKRVRRLRWRRGDYMFLGDVDREGKRPLKFAENGNGSVGAHSHFYTDDVFADDWVIT